MRVLVSVDANNVVKSGDGKYWCNTIQEYSFWLRYLQVFDSVIGAVRVGEKDVQDLSSINRVDGPDVEICEFPMLHGMKQYIFGYRKIAKASKKAKSLADCAIIRLPSFIGFAVWHEWKKTGKPYAIEVVVDPEQAYKSNYLAKVLFTYLLRKAVREADGVSYVTQFYLEKKYPCRALLADGIDRDGFYSYYSSIDLDDAYFAKPRDYASGKKQIRLVHTANGIHNLVKGHDILLKVTRELVNDGYNVKTLIVGDGRKKKYFESMSREFGIQENVEFTGLLYKKDELREVLLKSDIFVFPTRAEGLPRSLIEAMAVGLPCISTPIAGIPELLERENLIDPEDVGGFVTRIKYFIAHPEYRHRQSVRNISVAKEYRKSILDERRKAFYELLRDRTEKNRLIK